jgi:hypothetical protein
MLCAQCGELCKEVAPDPSAEPPADLGGFWCEKCKEFVEVEFETD